MNFGEGVVAAMVAKKEELDKLRAIGYVGANAAYPYAGSPPGPGYCWYYTDQNQTQGFWDVCPQQ